MENRIAKKMILELFHLLMYYVYVILQVLLGEIDEEKESKSSLKEVSLEEILEAQSKHQAEKEERDRLRAKAFKERGLSYTIEDKEDMY